MAAAPYFLLMGNDPGSQRRRARGSRIAAHRHELKLTGAAGASLRVLD
jgi:hypothetical protein